MLDDSFEWFNTVPGIDETFDQAIDFRQSLEAANWKTPSEHFQVMPKFTRQAVEKVVKADEHIRESLRNIYFPQLAKQGTFQIRQSDERLVEAIQRKRLYPGKVFAADGALVRYETLSMVGAQIAVARVSYQGSTGQFVSHIVHWGQEIGRIVDIQELVDALRSRGKVLGRKINRLFLETLMAYKEREILLDLGLGIFKLIQGPLFPYEMLVGSGQANTLKMCLDLLGRQIDDGAYATIVSSAASRDLQVLGMALNPGEYVIIRDGFTILSTFQQRANYTAVRVEEYGDKSEIALFEEFKQKYGQMVVEGILRTHAMSRPYVFYCNKAKVDEAVHTLFADAANAGARGFPLLINLADQYCSGSFSASEYSAYMNTEFVRASGGNGLYLSEQI